ncbi:MAG: hypothetical protein JST44_19635, partial [Cyanobacteria bacterium SZAS LIN-5]|nr:hypothetical protein [Cyanobacteria bacterium SZAS LIN-5]
MSNVIYRSQFLFAIFFALSISVVAAPAQSSDPSLRPPVSAVSETTATKTTDTRTGNTMRSSGTSTRSTSADTTTAGASNASAPVTASVS